MLQVEHAWGGASGQCGVALADGVDGHFAVDVEDAVLGADGPFVEAAEVAGAFGAFAGEEEAEPGFAQAAFAANEAEVALPEPVADDGFARGDGYAGEAGWGFDCFFEMALPLGREVGGDFALGFYSFFVQ